MVNSNQKIGVLAASRGAYQRGARMEGTGEQGRQLITMAVGEATLEIHIHCDSVTGHDPGNAH